MLRSEDTWLDMNNLPDDKRVWKSIHQGDTMGLFQIESPGQARMSVQLKPETLIDLAHQGQTVENYLKTQRQSK